MPTKFSRWFVESPVESALVLPFTRRQIEARKPSAPDRRGGDRRVDRRRNKNTFDDQYDSRLSQTTKTRIIRSRSTSNTEDDN